MENNELIRKLVLIDGLSQNAVAKRLGHSKRSVKRALANPEARQYMLSGPRTAPVADTVSAYSKATFVRAYTRDDMISFLDGHVHMFAWLAGVPNKLAYDNLKAAVAHVYAGKNRQLTQRFMALRSHYLFTSRFCNVASGYEKGHVENSVKRAERTYLRTAIADRPPHTT